MVGSEKTASIIIIGDEILSGRTQDTNVKFIAEHLSEMGIRLTEVRMIPDISKIIQKTVLELKDLNDYVFTTGGIGPTHDDITTESIAKAFKRDLEVNQEALGLMMKRCIERGIEMNEATKKMAILPTNVALIKNDISAAPGFKIENVFVFAGIPNIMQSMFLNLKNKLSTSTKYHSKSLFVVISESILAPILKDIQNEFLSISVGSYPSQTEDGIWSVTIVFRGKDKDQVEKAYKNLSLVLRGNQVSYK